MRPSDSAACVVDTHVWVWSVLEDTQRIGRGARRRLAQATVMLVPAICQWEVALLIAGRRLDVDQPATEWIEAAADGTGFTITPLTAEVAATAAELEHEGFHGDPADRMIYATARILDLPLLTADTSMRAFDRALPKARGRRVIWD